MRELKIDYVAHDAEPYVSEGHEDVYALVKRLGMFISTKRTPAISTSDLITRIIREYHAFVERNLHRGVSPKDMNISILTEGEIWLKRYVEKFLRGFYCNTIDQVKGIIVLKYETGNWKESTEELLQVIQKKKRKVVE